MPITIGSNIASLKAQRRLSESTSELSKTYERLSSGMRINRASDDAAGLSIADSLRADQRVFTQGIRNFNDGISLLTIADEAIGNLSAITVRLKELAEQSANGTYSKPQREAIDKEAQALSREYLRIAQSTKFNDKQIFSGNFGDLRLQGGIGLNGGIQSNLGGAIGTGSFNARVSYQVSPSTNGVQIGDFNGDGIADIASTSYTSTKLSISIGNGDGSFKTAVSYQIGQAVTALSTGDFNGDGILDLVSADNYDDTVSVLLGRGDGTFQSRTTYATGHHPTSVQTGDFNGDGILDFISADYASNSFSVLLGNGNGTFQPRISTTSGLTSSEITLGDFNGDGITDLIATDYAISKSQIFLGSGNGRFTGSSIFDSGGRGGTAGDFNGDGKLDFISADGSLGSISVFLGDGRGNFAASVGYHVSSDVFSVSQSDLNGDGILDIFTVDTTDNSVHLLLGNGNGTFGISRSLAGADSPRRIQAGDFNGDGVNDLVTANYGGNIGIYTANTSSGIGALLSFDLKTRAGSLQALPYFGRTLERLAAQRGQIGAFQSRVQVGIKVLQSTVENFASSESRIRDADIAQESANLVRLQILQQASASILGQANQQPQLALKLLKGGG